MEIFLGFVVYLVIGFTILAIAKVVGRRFGFDPDTEVMSVMSIMWPLFIFICIVAIPIHAMKKLFELMFKE